LDCAWRNLLVAQHHDIQIVGLLPDARRYVNVSLTSSKGVQDAALRFLASRMKGEGLMQVTVFNPVSWRRRQWIEVDLSSGKRDAKSFVVRCGEKVVPSALLSAHRFSDGAILEARLAFETDLPGLSFGAYSISTAKAPPALIPERVEIDPETLRITTPCFEVRLDPSGGIASLVDMPTRKLLLAEGKRSGFFAGRIDGQDCESHGRWTLHRGGDEAPWAVAREHGFIGSIPYTLELKFGADSPQTDCRVSFRFDGQKIGRVSEDPRDSSSPFVHEQKLRFRVFPALGEKAVGIRDLPFAVAETTNRYVEGNFPAVSVTGQTGDASLGAQVRLLDVSSENVILSALYHENNRLHLRLYESAGQPAVANVAWLPDKARLVEVDLLGRGDAATEGTLAFRPWQFRTLRLEPTAASAEKAK
jgi:alpha-mannosidase